MPGVGLLAGNIPIAYVSAKDDLPDCDVGA
jgi:hypothetical protein